MCEKKKIKPKAFANFKGLPEKTIFYVKPKKKQKQFNILKSDFNIPNKLKLQGQGDVVLVCNSYVGLEKWCCFMRIQCHKMTAKFD